MSTALQSRVALVKNLWSQVTVEHAKTVVFWYVVYHQAVGAWRHLKAKGLAAVTHELYMTVVKRVFATAMLIPSARKKVKAELDKVTLDIQKQIAPAYDDVPQTNELPATGLSPDQVSDALTKLSQLPNTKWETGRVSGAVYHGGEDMAACWQDAFAKFTVSNPLHADVFPGVRQMEAEVVNICLGLFNSPLPSSPIDEAGGVGTTTSGGTESILMACKAYRDRARAERGITKPEMIVPVSAHAAFAKAASYFGIKIHIIPVDAVTRKVKINLVKRAINPNTIMLVGSAPNFPDGIIDDIAALGKLAVRHKLGLHVDCCLGSFLMPFLERCGFPVDPFDFRVPGVTSISCDTHKYGFAPKGSSVIMYRSKAIRKYQYSVMSSWPGGVYATPSMAGSRPGAVVAGAWAAMQHMGVDGYTQSCREIVGAAKRITLGIRKDFPELTVLGDPIVSVVAFSSDSLPIYEVGDRMSKAGWHLNALQNPPALHIACTRLTVPAVDDLLKDLRKAVDEVKVLDKPGDGSMVTLYGLGSSSAVGPGLVEEMASRYMDVLYA
ncbi:hypothetical protein ACM66B_000462 [Microbotryomycetes sp. NB124-2]